MNVSPKTRRSLVALVTVTLLPVTLLHAQLELERHWRAQTSFRLEDLTLPTPVTARLLSLNYNTLAADVMWFALTAQHGEFVRYQSRASDNVLENTYKLVQTDPFFYRAYHWASGAFLNRRYPISDADLHATADLIEFGVQHHTTDPELRASLALLFVGYGKGFTDEERVRQSKRALEQLNIAVHLAPDDAQLVGVRDFFRHRIEKYGGEVSSDEMDIPDEDYWFALYVATSDERVRSMAANELRKLGAYKRLIERDVMKLQQSHAADKPYLPIELWLLTTPGASEADDG